MPNIPEYMRVRQYVVDLVMSHPNIDERIMSERELCSNLNVSRITARRALKGLVDDNWLYMKPGKGMFIHADRYRNSHVAHKKFYKVMVVFGDGKMVNYDGFFMDVLEHLCHEFKRLPILLQPISLISENGQTVDEIKMYRPDGIIWVRPPESLFHAVEIIRDEVPVCVVGNPICQDHFAVTVDYVEAGRRVAAYFFERGCRHPAFISISQNGGGLKKLVYDGWSNELLLHGIAKNDQMVFYDSDNTAQKVIEVIDDGIDGIFCFGSEFMAIDGAMERAGKSCPVIIDENYYGDYAAYKNPVAKLQLFPPEMISTAADKMFKCLIEPTFQMDEVSFRPTIIFATT